MNKNKNTHPISQKTIIIDKYDNDPKRNGDYIVISIMSNGKKITLYKLYTLVVDGFEKVNNRLYNIDNRLDNIVKKNNLKE